LKKGINQFCWPDSISLKDVMRQARKLGYECFEICMTKERGGNSSKGVTDSLGIDSYFNPIFNIESKEKDFKEVISIADGEGIKITGVGGILSFSTYPITSEITEVRENGINALNKMVEAAATIGADTVLVIPGMMTADMDYLEGYKRAQDAIAKVAVNADKFDVQLAVENVWNNYLYSPLELNRFVDEIDNEKVGVYFDIANARIFGFPEQWIKTLGKRIKKLHVKDFRVSVGNITGFTNLLDGDVDYPAVMKALNDIGYGGELVVELIPPPKYCIEEYLSSAGRVLDVLTK